MPLSSVGAPSSRVGLLGPLKLDYILFWLTPVDFASSTARSTAREPTSSSRDPSDVSMALGRLPIGEFVSIILRGALSIITN
jgi:hypothetical protein